MTVTHPVPHSEVPQAGGGGLARKEPAPAEAAWLRQPWTSHRDIGTPPTTPPPSPPTSQALPAQSGRVPCPDKMLEDSEMCPDLRVEWELPYPALSFSSTR